MNKRTIIEIALAVLVGLAFFWWLYLKPDPSQTLTLDSTSVVRTMESTHEKVLVIAVDGLDWDLLLGPVNEGRMPNLSRLLRGGGHGTLTSERPLIPEALWTTAITGVTRDVHGIDNGLVKVPFSYKEARVSGQYRKAPAIWELVEVADKSVGVVNWHATGPAEEVAGVFVAEEVFPGAVIEGQAYPEDWAEQVRTQPLPEWPPYEAMIDNVQDNRVRRAYDLDRAAFVAALEILRVKKPDLMMVNLRQTDQLLHGFWKYYRPLSLEKSFEVSREERQRYGGVILTHLELVDRMIGGLLSEAEGYTVLLVSAHGHGPSYQPENIFINLDNLLYRMGWLSWQSPTCDGIIKEFVRRGDLHIPDFQSAHIFGMCNALETESAKWVSQGEEMPAFAIEAFISTFYKFSPSDGEDEDKFRARLLDRLSHMLTPEAKKRTILWKGRDSKTRAWNVTDFHRKDRGIYLNVEDREPEGVVPLEDYDSTRRDLVRALKMLRTDSGRYLFSSVLANEDKNVMPLGEADQPDIIVTLDRKAILEQHAFRNDQDTDPVPLSALRFSYSDVSGDHESKGIIVVAGKRAAEFGRVDGHINDLAPTLLWLMGLPQGKDMPGKVLTGAFESPFSERPVRYIESWSEIEVEKSSSDQAD